MVSQAPLIVSFGEMLIDFVPDVSGVALAESNAFIKAPGGAPANVACAISKLGGSSAFIGKVGDDEFGYMLSDILKKNGVKTEGVCFDKEARTALAFVTLKKNGEREFISAHMAAMKAAKEAGSLLSYDPNVSDDEVGFLTKGGDPNKDDVVMSLWHDNLKLLVVTYGEKGCGYFSKQFKGRVPGFSVKTVDTTGAGDSFVGSFLFSVAKDPNILTDEGKLKEALMFSNACGAICTTQKGAIPALPTPASAQELINSSKK
ncbi:hypothetical protein Patl1_06895 [Pistacia atlantica]|uniref:Uncharacterized protein n=1 Tax=Pistacia atlantica TaxID=434234 RepID=A0ACC1AIX2_9ROSI|nr:hypothetical protein Patl1_06895 [Pistacia atlantica]